jgi:RNA polymerase sigma-70 factor, ECF subfamily
MHAGRAGRAGRALSRPSFVRLHPTNRAQSGSTGCVTDDELIRLAQAGDASAFDQLVVRHQDAVFRATMAALRDRHEAEEAAQDALVRAWQRLGSFRGEAAFRTWLLAIAWNRAMSRRRSLVGWFSRRAPIEMADGLAARHTDGPLDALRGHDLARHARVAIDALSPKLRDALLLVQSGDYGYGEVAAMLKVPVGTVKWRVSEARRRVRLRLSALGFVDGD